jgi:hypothetical protein
MTKNSIKDEQFYYWRKNFINDDKFCVWCAIDAGRVPGRSVMMGWNWRLRTAASTGLLFIRGWFAMWIMVWWYWLRSQFVYQSALAAPNTVRRPCRDMSGASGRVGEGNENLVSSYPWDLKAIFYMTWVLRLYFPPEGRSAADFYRS